MVVPSPRISPSAAPFVPLLVVATLFAALAVPVTAVPGVAPDLIWTGCAARTLTGAGVAHEAGASLFLGDLTGDGIPDLAIGAPNVGTAGAAAGAVYVRTGGVSGGASLATGSVILMGADAGDRTGQSIAGGGDVTGDGIPDLVIGAWRADAPFSAPTGAAYVVKGPITTSRSLAYPDAILYGAAPDDALGTSVAIAGDVNGDGQDDLLVGAPGRDTTGLDAGAAFLFYGPVSGTLTIAGADVAFTGTAPGDNAGYQVVRLGDVDGDGYDDIAISAPGHDAAGTNKGAVYIVRGAPSFPATYPLASAAATLTGEHSTPIPSGSLAGGQDLDGDGLPDLVVGVPFGDRGGVDAGTVYVVKGTTTGTSSLSAAWARLAGPGAGARAGTAVGVAADLTGDGLPDVLVGADRTKAGAAFAGSAHVVAGGPALAGDSSLLLSYLTVLGGADGDVAGAALAGGADLDGDGEPDLVIGIPGMDSSGTNRGAVAIVDRSTHTVDTDGDMLTDECESEFFATLPTDADTDGDGLGDGYEVLTTTTDPLDPDTDGDLFGDGTEVNAGSNPKNPFSVPTPLGPATVPIPPPYRELPITDDLNPLF